MKKLLLSIIVSGLLFVFLLPTSEVEGKVMWGNIELKKGQIGKVTALKNISVYKKSEDQYVVSRTVKKGQVFRVYTNRNGYLGIGGGEFVKQDNDVKYETPSKSRLQAVNGVKVVKKRYNEQTSIYYPQVTGMADSSAEKVINSYLNEHAKDAYYAYLKLKKEEAEVGEQSWDYWLQYEVYYNENNILSIVMTDAMYTGGAHGLAFVQTYNFDCSNGKLYQLNNTINGKTKTVKNYVVKDLQNQHKRGNFIFLDSLNSIQIDESQQWVFHKKGVKLIFQQYEVAPYAAGFPEVIVPESVYKK